MTRTITAAAFAVLFSAPAYAIPTDEPIKLPRGLDASIYYSSDLDMKNHLGIEVADNWDVVDFECACAAGSGAAGAMSAAGGMVGGAAGGVTGAIIGTGVGTGIGDLIHEDLHRGRDSAIARGLEAVGEAATKGGSPVGPKY